MTPRASSARAWSTLESRLAGGGAPAPTDSPAFPSGCSCRVRRKRTPPC